MGRLFIRKANDLIEAKCKLSLEEQKIMNFLIAQIKYEDTEFREYEITVDDFCKATGCLRNGVYSRLMAIGKILTSTTLYLETGEKFTVLSWLSEANYYKGESRLTFTFAPSLKPLLLELQKRGCFTKYEFSNIKRLNSVYSIRIYELLKEYENFKREKGQMPYREFSLDKLKEKLDVSDKYNLYADFKKNVLVKAKDELHNKCDIYFDYEEIKKGHTVKKIKFNIYKNPNFNVISMPQAKPAPSQTAPQSLPQSDGYYLQQLYFITELQNRPDTDTDAETIYKKADGDINLIRRRYEYVQTWRNVGNIVGAMLSALKKTDDECRMPISGKNGPVNKFVNFEQGHYNHDELLSYEEEQFKKSLIE